MPHFQRLHAFWSHNVSSNRERNLCCALSPLCNILEWNDKKSDISSRAIIQLSVCPRRSLGRPRCTCQNCCLSITPTFKRVSHRRSNIAAAQRLASGPIPDARRIQKQRLLSGPASKYETILSVTESKTGHHPPHCTLLPIKLKHPIPAEPTL